VVAEIFHFYILRSSSIGGHIHLKDRLNLDLLTKLKFKIGARSEPRMLRYSIFLM
jgi:hypothetical protein